MKTNNKRHLITVMLMIAAIFALTACGSSSDSEQSKDTVEPGWDYFEQFNPIGETYESISSKYDSLEDSGVYDGGVTLKVEDQELYFGFPKYSKEEIESSDTCTSVYGSLRTVFGITDDYASDDLEGILSLTWKQDYDDMYYANVTRPSGSYTVLLVVDTLNELYSPDTGVSIFIHDTSEGED
jgi:ABC-type oligopeptide transport system substrate-binding subunit